MSTSARSELRRTNSAGASSLSNGTSNEVFEMVNSSSTSMQEGESAMSGQEEAMWHQTQSPDQNKSTTASGVARHTLGLILILIVVLMWTLGNFLSSSIFADNTYAKPFFLTYLNTSVFMLAIVPSLTRSAWQLHSEGRLWEVVSSIRHRWRTGGWRDLMKHEDDLRHERREGRNGEGEAFLKPTDAEFDEQDDDDLPFSSHRRSHATDRMQKPRKRTHLGLAPTARLAFAFCILWFLANYFALACLQHTTVASATILGATATIWTLLLGVLTGVERFSWRKTIGVAAQMFGIFLISRSDLSNPTSNAERSPQPRAIDNFPDKAPSELAVGDALATFGAFIYGTYTILVKRATVHAEPLQLNMSLFFGLVGLINFVMLFPFFPILHFIGLEKFSFPPTQRIWIILLINSSISLIADMCWAYAMVLTTPLVVTVGLSLTIPFSLVGEMLIQGRYEGWIYWLGAIIVVGSFVFVDHEERVDDKQPQTQPTSAATMSRPHKNFTNHDRDEHGSLQEEMDFGPGEGSRRLS